MCYAIINDAFRSSLFRKRKNELITCGLVFNIISQHICKLTYVHNETKPTNRNPKKANNEKRCEWNTKCLRPVEHSGCTLTNILYVMCAWITLLFCWISSHSEIYLLWWFIVWISYKQNAFSGYAKCTKSGRFAISSNVQSFRTR